MFHALIFNTMTTLILFNFLKMVFTISVILAIVLFCILTFISASHRTRYQQDIIFLEGFLKNAPTRDRFEFCLQRFDELSRNNMNRKRTNKAYVKFREGYKDYLLGILLAGEEKIKIVQKMTKQLTPEL